MSIHFHRLTIKEVRRETPDCVSIVFDIPGNLQPSFAFTQGQNITIKHAVNGDALRRSYSICAAPHENELRVAVKKVPGGLFSSLANEQLKPGDTLEVLPPTGNFFTTLHPSHKKQYLALAAGSGITPVISIIKTVLQTEPQSTFTLVYGNRSRSSIIFFEELEGLKNRYMNRFNLIHVLSREKTDAAINFGRIGAEKCSALAGKLINFSLMDDIFVCGPEEMIFGVRDWLHEQHIDKKKIHFELFTTPGEKKQSATGSRQSVVNAGPKSKITVKMDGRAFDFELAFDSESILDAAIQQGADLPFSCKGGVCSTCRAKLTEGEVEMDVNYALEPEEIAHGFILTCQSHPKTARVVIDYDAR
jgi:ring-1,2-phenylacetyl-CoA epoxidase subunit PaaE